MAAIVTNAGADDRLSAAARAAVAAEDQTQGVLQDAEGRARSAATRRERPRRLQILQMEAQSKLQVDVGGGELASFDGIALDYQLDEPMYDESVPTLMPYILRWEESPLWPFKPAGARHGLKPVMGPKAWEAVLDVGIYCLRCVRRHAAPNPAACEGCGLTATHRENAINFMERAVEVRETFSPNRETRRAMKRAAKRRGPGAVVGVPASWG